MKIGIDVGSTTVKIVCYDQSNSVLFKRYERHYSKIEETLLTLLEDAHDKLQFKNVCICMAGSAGMDIANRCGITFTQEVIAATLAVETYLPQVDAVIEIGGEDVKVIFFDAVIDQRMNSTCAGGTGAFIDQMATLLDVTVEQLNDMALRADRIYPIASRCGVFAKTDIQALINQGAKRDNIAISIFQAVVNQTIAGLAQGRTFKGNVCFLGGPLTFFSALRLRFQETLGLSDQSIIFPDDSEYYIAMGCGLFAASENPIAYHDVVARLKDKSHLMTQTHRLAPLFDTVAQQRAFNARHYGEDLIKKPLSDYCGGVAIGIDAGSTTTKFIVIGEDDELLYSHYTYNKGSVIETVKAQLIKIMEQLNAQAYINCAGVTGYGEELIKAAFSLDVGEVETIAHFEGAKHFMPDVDFIIDIGGQDMKCLKIGNGQIESIILNEACSSGCGSFISSFANALGHRVEDFAALALEAQKPVDLGSRCTIFMNSSVKQAQKEGAKVEDISAGLAISVVKNALYKVLRMNHASELGEHIVVQGGTFYNDAILRAFEKETDAECIRPSIAGLMGAFGIALIAKQRQTERSTILALDQIRQLTYQNSNSHCRRCHNNCALTITSFSNGSRYITGNRCELGLGLKKRNDLSDMFKYKLSALKAMNTAEYRDTIGMPFVLNNYENRQFWVGFFDALNIQLIFSPPSDKKLYELGQHTIPSDTACYPAKVVHGHLEWLFNTGVKRVFYPSIVYNFREKAHPKNHYNCPVVASYPEVVQNNIERLNEVVYVNPYLTLNDERVFVKVMHKTLEQLGFARRKGDIKRAFRKGMADYRRYKQAVIDFGQTAFEKAVERSDKVIVLCGRPYHLDPEIHHGINDLITGLGAVVLTEDSVAHLSNHSDSTVLNQWTYHTRLYDAAKYVAESDYPYIQLVQLVSFGCGLDAITTDEVSRILVEHNKVYTQIKIDEMSNLGAVKIRLRSLLSTMEDRVRHYG